MSGALGRGFANKFLGRIWLMSEVGALSAPELLAPDSFTMVFLAFGPLLSSSIQNQCFVQGFRQLSTHLMKHHPCHGIWALSPLDTTLTCACHTKWRWRSPKGCACHEKSSSSENDAKVLHLSHRTSFETL